MDSFAVEFDFAARRERAIGPAEAASSCEQGMGCWIDIDRSDRELLEHVLGRLGLEPMVVEEVLESCAGGRHDSYGACVHMAVNSPIMIDGHVEFRCTDVLLGERFVVTVHQGPIPFLEQTRRTYAQSFARYADGLGFLLLELWDHLIESYRKCLAQLEDIVEKIQDGIFSDVDEEVFPHVSAVMHDLLELRRSLQVDREALQQQANRRDAFVPESAQPYLANLVGSMDRLAGDVAVEREALAATLTLYLGIVAHRTNKVITRLTVFGVIFLPLSFLTGVYGMNFVNLPEIGWEYGYAYFWCVVAAVAIASLWYCRHRRWL